MYAIVENGKIKEFVTGNNYNNISFGESATVEDRQKAGLYHVIDTPATLAEYQTLGNETWSIDNKKKTVTKIYNVIELTTELAHAKQQKINKLESSKSSYDAEPVMVREKSFFGGRDNAQKYNEQYNLMLLNDETNTIFKGPEEYVTVDADFGKEVIKAIGNKCRESWYKLSTITDTVNDATTVDEVNAINW